MEDSFFRTLSSEEETEFRKWAKDNWRPGVVPNPMWHPVVRNEWSKLNVKKAETQE